MEEKQKEATGAFCLNEACEDYKKIRLLHRLIAVTLGRGDTLSFRKEFRFNGNEYNSPCSRTHQCH
jgi:hypothetical protein